MVCLGCITGGQTIHDGQPLSHHQRVSGKDISDSVNDGKEGLGRISPYQFALVVTPLAADMEEPQDIHEFSARHHVGEEGGVGLLQ